jgi:uncharacterized protein (TIGR03435 family)
MTSSTLKAVMRAVLALLAYYAAYGQVVNQQAAFEVASIKPSPPLEGGILLRAGCNGGPGTSSPGLVTCINMSVRNLVMNAYGLRMYQIPEDMPGGFTMYDISASVPEGATRDQVKLMLRNLLAERFGLQCHHEKKEMQIYSLVVAKGGLKIKESEPEPPPPLPAGRSDQTVPPSQPGPPASATKPARDVDGFPIRPKIRGTAYVDIVDGRARVKATAVPISQLVIILEPQLVWPIFDDTGLTGKYDMMLTFAPEGMLTPRRPTQSESVESATPMAADPGAAPSIFSALQDQLGLKLEQKKGAVDVLVIDHLEKAPVEN